MDTIKKENYLTANLEEHCENENWCISCKLNKLTEVTVHLNDGKDYQYISRFPVTVGDEVIIGNQFPSIRDCEYGPMTTTGQFGTVISVKEKVEMKKNHAAELDFVFTRSASKQNIKECAKYLSIDDYFKTLQYSTTFSPIRPITHFARRILAASSILANQSLTDTDTILAAKETICNPPVLEEKVSALSYKCFGVQIDLSQVFVCDVPNTNDLPDIDNSGYSRSEALLGDEWGDVNGAEFIVNQQIQAYIAKYSYVAAVSIMIRGGFVNMLKAFFEQTPPINSYLIEIRDAVCAAGKPQAVALINQYLGK